MRKAGNPQYEKFICIALGCAVVLTISFFSKGAVVFGFLYSIFSVCLLTHVIINWEN